MRALRVVPLWLTALLCALDVLSANTAAVAAPQPATLINTMIQVGRYSMVVAGPTTGQRDLLAVTAPISIPDDIDSLGDALRWVLRESGYRLAADAVLPDEVHAMLQLPLPAAHRHFEPLPLKAVIELMVGPALQIVQDPVHRLLAFERCGYEPIDSSSEGTR